MATNGELQTQINELQAQVDDMDKSLLNIDGRLLALQYIAVYMADLLSSEVRV